MGQKVTAVRWSQKAIDSLQDIYDFYAAKSVQEADNVVTDVYNTAESIVFLKQYQVDEVRKDCRRMICRHFKILYKEYDTIIHVIDIFDTRSNSMSAGATN
jgi:plasmid stabilization system protein ParE